MKRLIQWAGLAPLTGLRAEECALCLIDFQQEYVTGNLPLPQARQAAEQAGRLLEAAERCGMPIIHVQHLAASEAAPLFRQGSPGAEILASLQPKPGQELVVKQFPGSFTGTKLQELLQRQETRVVLFAGLATHMCLSATVKQAFTRGYRCLVAEDACASRALPACDGGPDLSAEQMHRASLAALADRFAQVESTDRLVQWLR